MLIRVRRAPGEKPIEVGVCNYDCPLRRCFYVVEHMIRSPGAGYSGCSSRSSGWYECGTRDGRGCPPEANRELCEPPGWRQHRGVWAEVEDV